MLMESSKGYDITVSCKESFSTEDRTMKQTTLNSIYIAIIVVLVIINNIAVLDLKQRINVLEESEKTDTIQAMEHEPIPAA